MHYANLSGGVEYVYSYPKSTTVSKSMQNCAPVAWIPVASVMGLTFRYKIAAGLVFMNLKVGHIMDFILQVRPFENVFHLDESE